MFFLKDALFTTEDSQLTGVITQISLLETFKGFLLVKAFSILR
jgi:hypothetical protein